MRDKHEANDSPNRGSPRGKEKKKDVDDQGHGQLGPFNTMVRKADKAAKADRIKHSGYPVNLAKAPGYEYA